MIPVTAMPSAARIAQNKKDFLAQPGVNNKIKSIAKNLGVSVDEILAAMEKETAGSFSAAQRNLGDGKAAGLIQFYPDFNRQKQQSETYKTIGGTKYEIDEIERMPVLRQLNLVEEYLENQFKKKGGEPGELYVAIAYPELVGTDPSTPVPLAKQATVLKQNPGWLADGEKLITKASITAFGGGNKFVDAYDFSGFTTTEKEVFEGLKTKINNTNKSVEEKRALKDLAYQKTKALDPKDFNAASELFNAKVSELEQEVQQNRDAYSIEEVYKIRDDENASIEARKEADILIYRYENPPNQSATQQTGFLGSIMGYTPPADKTKSPKYKEAQKISTQNIVDFIDKYSKPVDTTTTATTTPTLTDREIAFQAEKNKDLSSIPTLDPVGDSAPELRTAITEEQDKIDAQKDFVDFLQPENAMMSDAFGDVTGGTRKDKLDLTKQKIKDKLPVIGEKTLNVLKGLADNVDKAFFALSAGAGIKNIFEATERDEVTKSHVSPLFKEALLKTRQASDQGMPYAQKQAALKDIAAAYSGAMKNVMAMSGGQRGLALSNAGIADASRVNALVDLAGKNAEIRQKNLDLYAKTAGAYSQQKLSADMNHAELSAKLESNRKNRQANIGLNLFKEATEYSRNYMDMRSFREAAQTPGVTADPVATENVYTNIDEKID